MDKRGLKLMTAIVLLALGTFSFYFMRLSTLEMLARVTTLTVILLVPVISLSYVVFRLAAREAQLRELFLRRGILIAYLVSKGEDVCKKQEENETAYLDRLKTAFDRIFTTEMKSEYGRWSYLTSILVGSVVTGLVSYYLAVSAFGRFLIGEPNVAATSFHAALVGAFAWNLWLLLSNYDKLDLIPATFYWAALRYVVAVVAGLMAPLILTQPLDTVFAVTATVMPYPRLLDFLRSKVSALKQDHIGEPPIWKIQGMPQTTLDRLETLGVYTTQELAYADPLMILFRTNFQPKVVIDWIDQCLLYNYVGEQLGDDLKRLRVRGIRGSIEMSGLKDGEPVIKDISNVLSITESELRYIRDKLINDYQVKLIATLWDEFKPLGPDGPLSASPNHITTFGTATAQPPITEISVPPVTVPSGSQTQITGQTRENGEASPLPPKPNGEVGPSSFGS